MINVFATTANTAELALKQMDRTERNELLRQFDSAKRFIFDSLLPSWRGTLDELVALTQRTAYVA